MSEEPRSSGDDLRRSLERVLERLQGVVTIVAFDGPPGPIADVVDKKGIPRIQPPS